MRAHDLMCSYTRRYAVALAVALMLTLSACGGSGGTGPTPDPDPDPMPDPAPTGFALTGNTVDRWMTIETVQLNAARNLVVEFALEEGGAPLSLTALDSDPSFLLGWIDETTIASGDLRTRYQSYVVNTRNGVMHDLDGDGMSTDVPVLASATQAGTDSGGTMEVLGGGRFRYTTSTALPANYTTDATHTIACYATRDGRSDVVNPYVHFVPSGATLSTMRDIIPTSSCTACHDKLAAHGGTRNEVILCQICHTDQTIDPETGNTVDFENMVHKIHAGSSLSSVYRIVGYRETVHDYHEITWTQDVRNCTSCHKDGTQSENYRLAPGRAACGSCHDDVSFVTGFEHNAGPFSDDDACASCHEPVKVADFDLSVPGSHAVPYTSSFNPNLTLAITAVSAMTPGNAPAVTFTATDNAGAVDISMLNRVAMVFAGPTPDYREYTSVTVSGANGTLVDNGSGSYTFTPSAFTIPATSVGTWSIGMEARTENIPVGGLTITNVRFGANNPVAHVELAVGTLAGSPAARRVIVDEAQCNTCHSDVLIHGNLRTDMAYCVMCHNGWTNDEPVRPGIDAVTNPPESVDFRYMIHKIHAGKELANGYLVYGFGGTPHDFSDVHFPRPINQCTACHSGGTQDLPISSQAQAQVFNWGGVGNILGIDIVPTSILAPIRPPVTATCLSCHDAATTAAHAVVQSIPTPILDPNVWVEACITCHGPGREFDARDYHK